MKNCFLFSILLFVLISADGFEKLPPSGSDEYKSFITWKEDSKLSWSDFQGKYIPNSGEAALTSSSVEYNYYSNGNKFGWTVIAKYFPKLSWSRKSDQSDYILQHEQLHFDITELYARLLRKELTENINNVRDLSKIKGIGKRILNEWDVEESRYDSETEHSINEEKQKEWILNIHQRLEELQQYASN